MAKPRVDPALLPFLGALAEILVAAILKDQESAQGEMARPSAEIVELHTSTTSKRASRRRAGAQR